MMAAWLPRALGAVSYTHLDVYKRQGVRQKRLFQSGAGPLCVFFVAGLQSGSGVQGALAGRRGSVSYTHLGRAWPAGRVAGHVHRLVRARGHLPVARQGR